MIINGRFWVITEDQQAEYFATLVNKGEKSSALRDYILFTAGVVVSAIVAVVLKHFGLA